MVILNGVAGTFWSASGWSSAFAGSGSLDSVRPGNGTLKLQPVQRAIDSCRYSSLGWGLAGSGAGCAAASWLNPSLSSAVYSYSSIVYFAFRRCSECHWLVKLSQMSSR